MPPKKAAAKAKTPTKAKATAAAEAPSTVTSSKGKVYEISAAAGRPRRASNPMVETPAPKKTATKPKAAATKKATGK